MNKHYQDADEILAFLATNPVRYSIKVLIPHFKHIFDISDLTNRFPIALDLLINDGYIETDGKPYLERTHQITAKGSLFYEKGGYKTQLKKDRWREMVTSINDLSAVAKAIAALAGLIIGVAGYLIGFNVGKKAAGSPSLHKYQQVMPHGAKQPS